MSNAPAGKGLILGSPPGGAIVLRFLAAVALFGISCGASASDTAFGDFGSGWPGSNSTRLQGSEADSLSFQSLDGTVSVNADLVFQTMEGFGTSQRVFDDPHIWRNFDPATQRSLTVMTTAEQDEILDLLYVNLGLTRVRPMTGDGPLIEPENDNADPNITDLTKFDFSWKKNDAHVDYVRRAMARGVTTHFLSTIFMESWMTESDPEEYVEWAMAILKRWQQQGLEMPYYSIMNEPGFMQRRGTWSGHYIRDVIKLLGPKLREAGLNTMIVVPDDLNPSQAWQRLDIILADPEARRYVGALAFHLYGEPISSTWMMKQLKEQYGIPLWMTEWIPGGPFQWANTMHTLISDYDVSAVDYFWGFTGNVGEADPNGRLITLNFDGPDYLGYTLEKQYYIVGQYSRFVKPGSRRVEATSTDSSVKVTAYKDGPDLILVAINRAGSDKTVEFSVSGISGMSDVQPIRTSRTENWAELPNVPVSGSAFTATLAPGSITTFIGTSDSALPNQAPGVDPGADQTLALPEVAALDGTVADDGLPDGTLITTWSVVSGPGTVSFGDANRVDTTVSFSREGEYVLHLMASDGDLSAGDEVTIKVNPLPLEDAPTRTPTPTPKAIPSPTPVPTPSPTRAPEPGVPPDSAARDSQAATPVPAQDTATVGPSPAPSPATQPSPTLAPEPSPMHEPTPAPQPPPSETPARASVSESVAASGSAAPTSEASARGATPGVILAGVLAGVFVVVAGASYVYLRRRG